MQVMIRYIVAVFAVTTAGAPAGGLRRPAACNEALRQAAELWQPVAEKATLPNITRQHVADGKGVEK
jgi:hypothetical protein